MKNIIIVAVILAIISLAVLYIYKSKKKGKKCIGCPNYCNCSSKKNGAGCKDSFGVK